MRLFMATLCCALALSSAGGLAQTPSPVQTLPLPPSPAGAPASGDPGLPPPPMPAPVEIPPATMDPATSPPALTRQTLVPNPGDPVNVDEVILPARPAAILSGMSTWDDGFTTLKTAFSKIEQELIRTGIAPTGRPVTVFLQTDDLGFRFEAMIPIAQAPAGQERLTPEIRFGKTPDGKALRFVHKDAYDAIDDTYETITAYLDAKNIVVRDAFIEEYVTDLKDPADPTLEINVFVQPKG